MSDIVVYGRGKTGQSLAKLVKSSGVTPIIYDDEHGFDCDADFCDKTVIVSPGVPPTANGLVAARRYAKRVVGELSYCFSLCKGRIVSVTGTNGKTTVCRLIKHILDKLGAPSRLLGNGGVPLSAEVAEVTDKEIVVLESSSFQLADAYDFAPAVSVFTNIAPDHLDYHGSYDSYVSAKCNNFLHQNSRQYAVFNADDKQLFTFSSHANCRVLYYSTSNPAANVYIASGNSIVCNFNGTLARAECVFPSDYSHNKSNVLAAITACVALGFDFASAVNAVADYVFLPHRIQTFATVGNVTFVDDSKGTNVHATLAALRCFEARPIALIVGGSDKGENFNELFADIPQTVVKVVAVGQTAERMRIAAARSSVDVIVCADYQTAVQACYNAVCDLPLSVVLMSNACASFDMFGGYAERGEYFQKLVKDTFNVS